MPVQAITPALKQAPIPALHGVPTLNPSSTVPLQSLSFPSQTSAPEGTQTQVLVAGAQVGVPAGHCASVTHSTQIFGLAVVLQ
jgi:hypothetical protein